MRSSALKSIIASELYVGASEMTQRFQYLRGSRLLPNDKGQASKDLTDDEIVNGVLSVMDDRPGFSALIVTCAKSLMPVRGEQHSYRGARNFGEALRFALQYPEEILEIRVKSIENDDKGIPPYARGARAQISHIYNSDKEQTAFFVPSTCLSLFQKNSEDAINYNPRKFRASYEREYLLQNKIFKKIHSVLKQENEQKRMLEKFG